MRRWGLPLLLAAVLPGLTPVWADDGMVLLQRMAQVSRQLTYTGTFVYRSGQRVETSRIAHTLDRGREVERIEVLDGSPREVIRDGSEVRHFLPDEMLLIIENQGRHRGFPALLPVGIGSLGDFYDIRAGGRGRVAGHDARAVVLTPRDRYRYGHELWMDAATGLLLKASLVAQGGETLESFAFTQVKLGGPLARDALKPGFSVRGLQVQQVQSLELKAEDMPWTFRNAPPGFRKVAAMRRQVHGGAPEILHVVFSDGLASISAFIESGSMADEGDSAFSMGPTNVYRRPLEGHRLMVMGEVPMAAVRRLGDGIERRRK